MRTGFSGNFYITWERIEQTAPIPPSAMQSLDEGETLHVIRDTSTIGKTPDQFQKGHSFWIVSRIVELNS